MTAGSLISDDLLRHLMAAGQVDMLVGVPTLNNASTVRGVVQAVHGAITAYFSRDRIVILNPDSGSSDGTPALFRGDEGLGGDSGPASRTLRTIHRISTPSHEVGGRRSALHQIMAAADLTQARAIVLLDPDVTSLTPEWVAALVRPVLTEQFDYVAPTYPRHPLEGPLVTQLVRPLLRAAYGRHLREPISAEFACSGRFATLSLEQDFWETDYGPAGMDVVMTATALAGDFRCCQAPVGPRLLSPGRARAGLREVFQQVVSATFSCLDSHAGVWTSRTAFEPLPTIGRSHDVAMDAPRVDAARLTQPFRDDMRNLQVVLTSILTEPTRSALDRLGDVDGDRFRFPDELWVSTVNEFLLAHHRGVMRREHIAQALMPLYLGRTGSFLTEHAADEPAQIEDALESLCQQFERSKRDLVDQWNQPMGSAP